VIDAAGARSPVRGWLGEEGVTLPPERIVACGIAYCSRFFQLRPGADPGPLNRGYTGGGSFDRYSCLVFPADNRTFSVTLGLLPEDRALMRLHEDDAFVAAARSVELVADWVDPERAEPIGQVAAMRGLNNRWRPLVEAGRPPVLGVLAVGDSACITNPAHTRGSTLALVSALAAARAIDAHPADPATQLLHLDAELRGEQEQWWFDSVQQDAARLARWRPQMAPPDPPPDGWVSNGEAYLAAQRDPRVWRAFTRAQQLLIPAADVLGDTEVVARVRQVQAEGWSPPGLDAPGHDELVAVAAAASDGLAQGRAVG
jgi:flavin-dependent dehydrogenase